MEKCKLRKGDRIYECRYRESVLTELITDPELIVQGSDSHYWHWKARVIKRNSHWLIKITSNAVHGEIIDYGITEENPEYGPYLYRQDVYKVGLGNAERILPPFATGVE